eukprot:jgi/Chlat1/1287/Chrsp118S00073
MAAAVGRGDAVAAPAVAFRVMRLCRPALQVDLPLRVDPNDIKNAEDLATPPQKNGEHEMFSARSELHTPGEAFGLTGMLVLPVTFGTIYLGETFSVYISVGNYSLHEVTGVGIKAELQTERQRISLWDNTATPITSLPPGSRHDFSIEHDIKELGAHTLMCSATYLDSDSGARQFLPQYYKFVASNPLSVRTKVRSIRPGDATFLEACIENCTKGPLFLEDARLEPSAGFVYERVGEEEGGSTEKGFEDFLDSSLARAHMLNPNGGSRNFLFKLTKKAGEGSDSSNTLGKLEITWRSTLGETGRLQTQQILGTPIMWKEVQLVLVSLQDSATLEHPFKLTCQINNNSDHRVGPLRIIEDLMPSQQRQFQLMLVPLVPGVQRITGLCVTDARDGKPYDTLTAIEVYVQR